MPEEDLEIKRLKRMEHNYERGIDSDDEDEDDFRY